MNTPLFAQVLGHAAFAQLPEPVRALHSVRQRQTFAGQAQIRRGRHVLVPLLALLSRLPRSGAVAVEVDFLVDARGERWHRRFAGLPMYSRLWRDGERLREHLGAVRFEFALRADTQAVYWQATRVWAFGWVPLPARWFEQVRCREHADTGRYGFLVDVHLPLVGPFIRYEGWLEPR
ncbi:DUF4166 domain-containing protein [Xanthomonas sp. NCPPB 1067]|uniref:DUF4166 domain-containing protein n=1 Tax=Xanthomonas sp. NCPPB 1067 TaxID=487524 RepID=UPI001E42437E|nr:DUF4166 domain-containing protein [Xanthomonas sp. NCPPB 1067]MCC4588283.1 DUF4166 domain-containing protein [Xanthomonas sp. NCPPB 1067]